MKIYNLISKNEDTLNPLEIIVYVLLMFPYFQIGQYYINYFYIFLPLILTSNSSLYKLKKPINYSEKKKKFLQIKK